MEKSKAETFIGFCVRARKITVGANAVEALKRGVYMILVCATASENTFGLAVQYKNKFRCPLVICKNGLENVIYRPGCKIAAIRDRNLASAVKEHLDNNFELYAEGSN